VGSVLGDDPRLDSTFLLLTTVMLTSPELPQVARDVLDCAVLAVN